MFELLVFAAAAYGVWYAFNRWIFVKSTPTPPSVGGGGVEEPTPEDPREQ